MMMSVGRRCGPKKANHPSIGDRCPCCGTAFVEGDMTQLCLLGPADPEEREKAVAGAAYTGVAVEVHASCADVVAAPWSEQ